MKPALLRCGQLSGLIGILMIVIAGTARLGGSYVIGSFTSGTVLITGIAAIVVGCFLLLWVIAEGVRT